ncbi:murein biosynthesis integral membrane protein MurJ [Geodermatophilus sp. SYSU D01105]
MAAVLGPTRFGDLYQAANTLPNLTFELLTGTMLVSLVVPALVRHFDQDNPAAVNRLASGFLTLSVLVAMGVVALGIATGPLILGLLSAGVPEDADTTGTATAWVLLALLLLQVPLYLVASMGAAVQNARGRFALAAAAPVAENLGIIVVLGLYALVRGSGPIDEPTLTEVALLGGGTTAAVLLHAAVQWFGAHRCGVPLRPAATWRDPEVRELVRLAVPSLGSAGLNVAGSLCPLVVAAAVPGGVVALSLALAFYGLPGALITKPVSQAALPELSRAHHRGVAEDYGRTFDRTFGLAMFLTVPAAIGYTLLSGPLATVVSFGDMATPGARNLVRVALLGLGLGVIGWSALFFATRAAYARRDARRPLVAVAIRNGLALSGLLAGLALLDGSALLLGIGLVIAVSDLASGALLCWWLRRGLPRSHPSLGRTLLRTTLAGLAMVPVVLLVLAALAPGTSRGANVLTVLLAGTAGAVTYLAVQRCLRSPELADLLSAATRRGRAG